MDIKLDFEQRHRANEMLERISGADLEEFVFEFIATRDAYNKIRRTSNAMRETLAAFMFKHGFATGHGDTIDDLFIEFDWQVTDLNNRLATFYKISEVIRTADNSADYSAKKVIADGVNIGTVGNLLVEMTTLPALQGISS